MASISQTHHDHRPEFMVTLGLAPPYAIEDVKQAYRERARQTHPDRGGSVTAFNEVQQAFERAQEYLTFRADRRGWIAARMERYTALQQAIGELQELGAEVTTHAPEWLALSFGDFAQLTETVTAVRLADSIDGDRLIATMVARHDLFRELETVELPRCEVSDEAVLRLGMFQLLKRLDLSYTPVSGRALDIVDRIETLETINLEGAEIGWWPRWRTAAKLRGRSG